MKLTIRRRNKLLFRPNAIIFFIIYIALLFIFSTALLVYKDINFWDSAYWSACSLTWSKCTEIEFYEVLNTPELRIMSIVNGLTTIIVVLVMLYTFGDKLLHADISGVRMRNKIKRLKGHFIVCGYGRVGQSVCDILEENNFDYVVIEDQTDKIARLKENDIPVINGDATDTRVLEEAGIARAYGLVSALGSDADNIFVTLTAKELNPNIQIATRAHSEDSVPKLHKAGAEVVVLPEIIGGLELGKEILQLDKTHTDKLISRAIRKNNHNK